MNDEPQHQQAEEPPENSQNPDNGPGDEKGAAVKFPPPAIFVILIFVGAGLDYVWPLGLGVADSFEALGIAITLFGVTVAILVNGTFKREGTAIEPWKPTTKLITTGLYAWTRNPIYLGFCLFNIGIGIASNSFWILITFIPGAFLVYYIAIAKEEAYLQEKFGDEYRDYVARVRRWL
ncbi:MAG: isoprenylcysteine carboxylmethyltransferase family protein [Gammaproteobacteria bacterium]|jgi:protein-S-isoprenylcysteine O-methyltransferase Ste14|nr:isoprenylcysteine carboxylmethyltransferase family protein [Gammaproteobacteria bacterium]MDP6537456.1 isoprenylcysteine carboxylmethyltransferase family protein [Gammaproteobacteria bacterium]MDP6734121.1 isoprenylcysteine carboxylmethyltransferase family protein [Gammaproteobacteria bacterium]|tara:strand:+ start:2653 stop:3186 length:534 start_codon:yes stop_codon:yes gene_type:complete